MCLSPTTADCRLGPGNKAPKPLKIPYRRSILKVKATCVHSPLILVSQVYVIDACAYWSLVHNALIWTCTETRRDAPNEMQVYVEYLTFWKSIFQTEEPQSFDLNDQFLGVLYDSFLTALLRLLRLFNLEVTSETAPDTTPDKPTQGGIKTADDKDTRVASAAMLGTILQPVNEMDFVLFHNIVGFWCALVPQLRGERLIQWIQIAGLELIQLSIRQPLVSGFYRMLAIVITITDRVGCFRESQKLYHKEHEALNAFEPTSRVKYRL